MARPSPTHGKDLWAFLKSRGIPEENIQKMQQEKIDCSVVGEVDDTTLAIYIPAYGDRIAVRRFCMEKQQKTGGDTRKMTMFEKLKRKMETKTNKNPEFDEELSLRPAQMYLKKNKRAWKTTRKIEIGWLHERKMVRKRNGGGTRVIDISKSASANELLSQAKALFFPNNESKMGNWEEFNSSIVDFKEAPLDEHTSVGELYETHKFGMLRFYLSTETKEDPIFLESEENVYEDIVLPDTAEEMTDMPHLTHQPDSLEDDCPSLSAPLIPPALEIVDLTSICNTSEVIIGALQSARIIGVLDDTVPFEPFQTAEHHGSGLANTNAYTSTPIRSETEPAPLSAPPGELLFVTVKLHRVNLLEELITQFKDEVMLTHPIKYRFVDEKGADADGVSRDVYAAFWTEFLDCAAEGADVRVPSLSPRWQEEEWRSVGRIMVKGLKDHGYFPARLAQAFIAAVIFGEHSVSPDLMFDSLMLYLSQSERDLLTTALKETLVGDDQDELLDIMDRMGVRTVPTLENMKPTLLQVAHKQIIQQPKYALDNIAAAARPILRQMIPSLQELHKMFEQLKPTTRKVIKLLTASPSSPAENQSLRFLQQYIRELDDTGLRKFLRFVTGSDVICVKEIEVLFTTLEGFGRRLIAHTCGPTLELPSTYNGYPELRAEIEPLLSSNHYIMDIA